MAPASQYAFAAANPDRCLRTRSGESQPTDPLRIQTVPRLIRSNVLVTLVFRRVDLMRHVHH